VFRHVASFKLKDDEKDMIQEIKRRILELKAIPQVRSIEMGIDEIKSPRSFDFAIIVDFDSYEDYMVYDTHELHVPAKEFILPKVSGAAAVDYYVD